MFSGRLTKRHSAGFYFLINDFSLHLSNGISNLYAKKVEADKIYLYVLQLFYKTSPKEP
jgi:hypothetical protein